MSLLAGALVGYAAKEREIYHGRREIMEIIARRKESVFKGFVIGLVVICIALAWILIYISRLLGMGTSFENVPVLLLGIFIFGAVFAFPVGILIWQIKKFRGTPQTPIVLENGKIRFANHFECSISEIQNVTYRQARGGRYGWYSYSWGRITVNVRGRDITYDFIENVVAVYDRLLALMLRAKES